MDAPTLIHRPAFAPEAVPAPAAAAVHPVCDECAAPVAVEQRYCVNCGAHRRNVNDPATRYLGRASVHVRSAGVPPPAVADRPRGRALGVGTALVLAAIPVAAGLGVLAGGSSGSGDAALVRALAHQSAADNSLLQALGTGTSSGATAAASTSAATSARHPAAASRGRHHTARTASASSSSKASGPALNTAKPSQAQVKTGASVVQKIQRSSGKGYVNSQSGLPGTIVVP